jgi:hypothetical protein
VLEMLARPKAPGHPPRPYHVIWSMMAVCLANPVFVLRALGSEYLLESREGMANSQ